MAENDIVETEWYLNPDIPMVTTQPLDFMALDSVYRDSTPLRTLSVPPVRVIAVDIRCCRGAPGLCFRKDASTSKTSGASPRQHTASGLCRSVWRMRSLNVCERRPADEQTGLASRHVDLWPLTPDPWGRSVNEDRKHGHEGVGVGSTGPETIKHDAQIWSLGGETNWNSL